MPSGSVRRDEWLSLMMAREVSRLVPGDSLPVLKEGTFYYARVDCGDLRTLGMLEASGFRVIDTNVTFRKRREDGALLETEGGLVRWAQPSDEDATVRIASTNIVYSRFHLDPAIPRPTADFVKSEWVRNYFKGTRGERLALAEADGAVAGFLQIIFADRHFIIDLIAVDRAFQRRGLAQAMIRFAESELTEFDEIVVGTQVANVPSIRMYEKLGFRMTGSAYVLHRH